MKTSTLIAIWRDILAHYAHQSDRQQQLLQELLRTITRHLTPPP